MTTSKPSALKKSPWAREYDEAPAPLTAEQIEILKGQWIREETAKFLEYNDHARHHALQDCVSKSDQFPNKMSHIAFMIATASHFDMMEHYIIELASGGRTPESYVLEMTGEDEDVLSFMSEQMDDMTTFEGHKAEAQDETEFKLAFIAQMVVAIDIYQSHLEYAEVNDEIGLMINDAAMTALEKRSSSKLKDGYEVKEKGSIAHWPMAGKIAEALTHLQSLHMQAAATLFAMENSGQSDQYQNQAAYKFTQAVHDFTVLLRDNLQAGLGAEIYFQDFMQVQEQISELYGEEAYDPDTEWDLDENLLLQAKINILSHHIIANLLADNPYDDEPEFANLMAQVSAYFKEVIADKYKAEDASKPAFIAAHEKAVLDRIYQDTNDDDTLTEVQAAAQRPAAKPALK